MNRPAIMWAKLAALAVGVALLLALLLAPVMTVKIRIDLPPAQPAQSSIPAPSKAQVEQAISMFGLVSATVVLLIIMGPAGYAAWRIVRAHTRSPDQNTEP